MKTIAVVGTLDSKAAEHAFVAEEIRRRGHEALLIDVGSGNAPGVTPDITREAVAAAASLDWPGLMARKDRGECVAAMSQAIAAYLSQLVEAGGIHGVISLGGGGGTAIATAGMRALPLGFPKVMVSTMAAGNVAPYLGTQDIVMFPSITDVAGVNRWTRSVFRRAAGAIVGMVEAEAQPSDEQARPLVVASMFGNTTECVTEAQRILEEQGYEVLVFAATGAGGRAMEAMIESGIVSGVLDVTTTEWADEHVGGVLAAGPHRLDAAARAGVPAVIAPGCLDMVNFGEPASVPEKFAGRVFYHHNPQVTLMRTTPEENEAIGTIIGKKLQSYNAPLALLIPSKAISVISAKGQAFHDPAADLRLFNALETHSPVLPQYFDEEINSPVFARACAERLVALMKEHQRGA